RHAAPVWYNCTMSGELLVARTTHFRVSRPPLMPLRPPLKWAGGKRWLVPHLVSLWKGQPHRRLVEPFCGGLAVSLGLSPKSALLNDLNPHLINFYVWLQRGLHTVRPLHNSRRSYDASRECFNRLIADGQAGSQDAAVLFYYLNRTGFN